MRPTAVRPILLVTVMLLALGAALGGCGGSDPAPGDGAEADGGTDAEASGEQGGARSGLAPADIDTARPAYEQVLGVAERPVRVAHVGGEPRRYLVASQEGRLWLVGDLGCRARAAAGDCPSADQLDEDATLLLDLRDEVSDGSEQGLLGVAVAEPGDDDTRRAWINYTAQDGATHVVRYGLDLEASTMKREEELLRVEQPYANHNGGHLLWTGRHLWIGLGDGGDAGDPEGRAQDPSSLLGSMLRYGPDGRTAAPANPALPGSGVTPTWAIGLRNPWRYSIDEPTGTIWIGDVGQDQVEEIDVLQVDRDGLANLGWKLFEGSREFAPDAARGPGELVGPVHEYAHADGGCSVTGGRVYRGDAVPGLRGWYLFADVCEAGVRAIPATARPDSPVADAERLDGPSSIVSFDPTAEGELLLSTLGDGVQLMVAGSEGS